MIWSDNIILPPGIKIHDYQIQDNGICILFLYNVTNDLWAAAVYDCKNKECLEIDIFSKKRFALACYVDRMKYLEVNPLITDWIRRA